MGDVQDCNALFPQREDLLEQDFDFLVADCGRGFVHDYDRGVHRDCLCNLDQLMARDGQLVHLLMGIVGNVQPVKKLLRIGVHLRVVYEHPLARLAASQMFSAMVISAIGLSS